MRFIIKALAVIFGVTLINAETRISGDIGNINFDASGNPFIVEKDIVVSQDEDVVIKEGCVLLFNVFTGMQVRGRLTVSGTAQAPVVFTSINDKTANPNSQQIANPFDWNGILILRESPGVTMNEFKMEFSTFGIKAQTPQVRLQNGLFSKNGQFHFTINEKLQYVQEDIPFSTPADTGSTTFPYKKRPKTRKIIRWSGLGIGIVGIGAGTVYAVLANQAYGKAIKQHDNIFNANSFSPADNEEYGRLQEDFNKKQTAAIVLESLGCVGLAMFGLTFLF
jgi:hypothetical protein